MKKVLCLSLFLGILFVANVDVFAQKTTKKEATKVETKKTEVKKETKVETKTTDKAVGKDKEGRTIFEGPRGGRYYINGSGNKVYVDKDGK
jgi:colicin import membrane protein